MLRFHPGYISLLTLAASSGCFLLDQPFIVPLELSSPEQDVDISTPVSAVEAGACVAPDDNKCLTLRAMCQTEAGRDCTNPTLPDVFPREILVGTETVSAEQALDDIGVTEATQIEVALPVDVSGTLDDAGLDASAIDNASIVDVAILWPENSLTFDSPPVDLYLADKALDADEALDAQALIDAGTVIHIGTAGIDLDGDGTFDVGQVAGSTADVPVEFVDGGKARFEDAIKRAEFTIVTASSQPMRLKAAEGDDSLVQKPSGTGAMRMRASIEYAVAASDVIDRLQ